MGSLSAFNMRLLKKKKLKPSEFNKHSHKRKHREINIIKFFINFDNVIGKRHAVVNESPLNINISIITVICFKTTFVGLCFVFGVQVSDLWIFFTQSRSCCCWFYVRGGNKQHSQKKKHRKDQKVKKLSFNNKQSK